MILLRYPRFFSFAKASRQTVQMRQPKGVRSQNASACIYSKWELAHPLLGMPHPLLERRLLGLCAVRDVDSINGKGQ